MPSTGLGGSKYKFYKSLIWLKRELKLLISRTWGPVWTPLLVHHVPVKARYFRRQCASIDWDKGGRQAGRQRGRGAGRQGGRQAPCSAEQLATLRKFHCLPTTAAPGCTPGCTARGATSERRHSTWKSLGGLPPCTRGQQGDVREERTGKREREAWLAGSTQGGVSDHTTFLLFSPPVSPFIVYSHIQLNLSKRPPPQMDRSPISITLFGGLKWSPIQYHCNDILTP